jgi:hypothetical protein
MDTKLDKIMRKDTGLTRARVHEKQIIEEQIKMTVIELEELIRTSEEIQQSEMKQLEEMQARITKRERHSIDSRNCLSQLSRSLNELDD